jgi:hypothetical protein
MGCWNPSTLYTNMGLQELPVGIPLPQIPICIYVLGVSIMPHSTIFLINKFYSHMSFYMCFDWFKKLRLFVIEQNLKIDVVLKASRAVVIR